MTRFNVYRASVWVALALGASAVVAAPASRAAAASVPMGFQQVVDRVVTAGFTDVREVERKSDKLYEIKARNGQGQRVELYVDSRSGEILREEVKR